MPRFQREYFMNSTAELGYLMAHVIPAETREFGGAKITGSNEAPTKVELYRSAKPEYNEQPFAVYTRDDMDRLVDPTLVPVVKHVIRRTRR